MARQSPQTYFPWIRQAATQYHVPADLLAAQIDAESSWDPTVVSPAGAVGLSQFMPATARGFGIDPHDPHQSIEGQARYMHNLIAHYKGNIPLALAAYNAGTGAVDRYGGIPPYAETQGYVKTVQGRRARYPGLANGQAPAASGATGTPAPGSTAAAAGGTPAAAPSTAAQQALASLAASSNAFAQQTATRFGLPTPPALPTPLSLVPQTPLAAQTPLAPQIPATGAAPPPPTTGWGIYNRKNLGRTDQGVDYTGKGPVPAVADAVITRVVPNGGGSGWPGGGFVVYQITSGPQKGRHVFLAENIDPTVKVGQRVRAGQTIATARGTNPWTETGWAADARGTTLARATTGYTEGQQTNAGKDFLRFLRSIGAA